MALNHFERVKLIEDSIEMALNHLEGEMKLLGRLLNRFKAF